MSVWKIIVDFLKKLGWRFWLGLASGLMCVAAVHMTTLYSKRDLYYTPKDWQYWLKLALIPVLTVLVNPYYTEKDWQYWLRSAVLLMLAFLVAPYTTQQGIDAFDYTAKDWCFWLQVASMLILSVILPYRTKVTDWLQPVLFLIISLIQLLYLIV